jgi:hypothetical protein
MASLIAALDKTNFFHEGENGHIEHAWSNNIQEEFVQLKFQFVRCQETTHVHESSKFNDLKKDFTIF